MPNRQSHYTEMANILQFTINDRRSQRLLQFTSQLLCENHKIAVWVDLHYSLCRQRHPEWVRETRLLYLHFFFKLQSSFNPPKKIKPPPKNNNLKELGLEIHIAPSRRRVRIKHTFTYNVLVRMTDALTYKNIDRITLYNCFVKYIIVRTDIYAVPKVTDLEYPIQLHCRSAQSSKTWSEPRYPYVTIVSINMSYSNLRHRRLK